MLKDQENTQLESIDKKQHELTSDCFLNWAKIEFNRIEFIAKGLSVPNSMATEWDTHTAIVGSYRWEIGEAPERDLWLAKLAEVNVNDIFLDPGNAEDMEWDYYGSLRQMNEKKQIIKNLGTLLFTTAYRDKKNRLISRNDSYLIKALKEMGIKTVACWIIETENDYAVNRKKCVQSAIEKGLKIPDDVMQEYMDGKFKLSAPLRCPTFSDKELARAYEATSGDKIGSIIKAMNGDISDLEKIDEENKKCQSIIIR